MSAAPKQQPAPHDPWDTDCEQALLGSLLKYNRLIDVAAADLEGLHFYDPMHGRMYDLIVALSGEGVVNPIILHSVMKADAGVLQSGGIAYIEALYGAAPALPPIKEFVRILLDLAMRRDLIRISEDLRSAAHEPPNEGTAQIVADRATEALLQAGRASAPPILSPYETAMESIRECERIARGEEVSMVKTGWQSLDDEIGGLRGGDLIVFPGKSGMGKSALMVSLSLNTALAGVPTLVFSLEMTRRQWVERMVCALDFETAEKAMWYSRVRNGKLSNVEFERFFLASGKLEGLPLEIHDADDLTMQQMHARARAFKAKHGKKLGIVLLDYLQIVEPADPRDNRERQVARNARGAKSMAKQLGWPVGAGSQMNEDDKGRVKEEQRPRASDVRESKGIMNEADLMMAPHRPAWFLENRKPADTGPDSPEMAMWRGEMALVRHKLEVLGLKNRHGRRFDLELWCEIGSNAILDQAPYRRKPAEEQAASDLLGVLNS